MIRETIAGALGAAVIVLVAAAFVFSSPVQAGECHTWVASWYGTESGNKTANGEHFNGKSLTAAHRTLPFGTKLRVMYQGKSVVVRVNDRGPFHPGRSLDLAQAAADRIGLTKAGVARVKACRVG